MPFLTLFWGRVLPTKFAYGKPAKSLVSDVSGALPYFQGEATQNEQTLLSLTRGGS